MRAILAHLLCTVKRDDRRIKQNPAAGGLPEITALSRDRFASETKIPAKRHEQRTMKRARGGLLSKDLPFIPLLVLPTRLLFSAVSLSLSLYPPPSASLARFSCSFYHVRVTNECTRDANPGFFSPRCGGRLASTQRAARTAIFICDC